MAGFKTHLTTSTLIGIGYASVGHVAYQVPLPTAVLAGGLCSLAGILPDVDSDTGRSQREITGFVAAVVPMLLIERFIQLGLTHETIVLAAALTYIVIRFGLTRFLQRFTVHRGMWHSLPAAAIAGLITALLCSCPDSTRRMFKVGGVVTGYVWHLLLDEFYAMHWENGRFRFKKSFGTAFKMFGKNPWANLSTYGKLMAAVILVMVDPPVQPIADHTHDHSVAEQLQTAPQYQQPAQQQYQPAYQNSNSTYAPPATNYTAEPQYDPYSPISR